LGHVIIRAGAIPVAVVVAVVVGAVAEWPEDLLVFAAD